MTDRLVFAAEDLVVSPLNVRFNEDAITHVEALAASIVAEGLLQPLILHPVPEGADWAEGAKLAVLAGGRRYRAIRMAIERGDLPKDFQIAASVKDLSDAQIRLLSLSENLLRRDLELYEVNAAIAGAIDGGLSEQEIAAQLGQNLSWVKQQRRLGELHPPIFKAFCEGALDLDQAQAFGATKDTELQAAAWAHFANKREWDRRPHAIRAYYKIGNHDLDKLLKFVGLDTYRAAGGTFELDLFATQIDQRGRVADEQLLEGLVADHMGEIRSKVRAEAGWKDLRFAKEPPKRQGYTDRGLEIEVKSPKELAKRVPKGTPDGAILAVIEIHHDGDTNVTFWWNSAKAKREALKAPTASAASAAVEERESQASSIYDGGALQPGYSEQEKKARALVRDEHGLTASGLQVVRSQRRDILRAVLMKDAAVGGSLARDYLTFALLRQELGDDWSSSTGLPNFAKSWTQADGEPKSEVEPYCKDQLAAQYWRSSVEHLLGQPFMTTEDLGDAFEAFLALDDQAKNEAAAILAGLELVRSCNAQGYKLPLHDKIAGIAGADASQVRRFWQPDRSFVSLFPRLNRMEMCEPFVERQPLASWKDQSDTVLSETVSSTLKEQARWVHPLVKFDFDGFEVAEPAEDAKELEAAE